jgi:2,3-dihydroxybenzoate-AMP ligase
MNFEGFNPYDEALAREYEARRWWLGMTMGDTLDKASDLYPFKEALIGSGQRYTYAELRLRVDNMAYNLLQQGLTPGDTIFLQLPNCPEFVIAYYAIQKAGLVVVLLTVNHTAREVAHIADLTQPKGWFVTRRYRKTDFAPLIKQVQKTSPALKKIIVAGGEISQGQIQFEDLLKCDAGGKQIRSALEQVRPSPRDVCQVLPSGGTTGLPKGAPRTHNDYLSNVEYVASAWNLNVSDRCLVATTVGHNLALLVLVTPTIFLGATMVMVDSTRPSDFCRAIQEEQVTCTALVPTLISRIVSYEKLPEYDLSSLKKVYVGAANSPPELVKATESKLGCRYTNAFGMAEGACAQTRFWDNLETRCETIGLPCCPYDDFRTLDSQGEPTPAGIEGELAAKGPGIFSGYLKNPQANQEAFTPDGYFRTGDIAVIDANSIVRITGRIKDIIIRGGENIAARDVEDMVSSHPDVEYVAAVGMPDPELGEQVCAYIKTVKGATITQENIIDYLKSMDASRLHYPARIEFIEKVPLTAAGKVDKKILTIDITQKIAIETK